jgi:hypothetical protein
MDVLTLFKQIGERLAKLEDNIRLSKIKRTPEAPIY